MFDPNLPVRASNNSFDTYKIIGRIDQSRDHSNQPRLIVITTNIASGDQSVAYRNLDGTHPNGMTQFDLVNIDTNEVATMYQTQITPDMAKAIKTLWLAHDRNEAVALMTKRNSYLNSVDVRHYFTGLFGD